MRILVVDDHDDSLDLHVEWLRLLGQDAVGARSVADALAEAAKTPPEVVVTDIRLPDGDGAELVTRLRAAGHTARTIAVTGLPPPYSPVFDEVLVKPIALAALRSALGIP